MLPVVLNAVKSSHPCYLKHYKGQTLGDKGKETQSHFYGLESLQLRRSGKEKEGQLNPSQRRQKDKIRQRKGTFAEDSFVCRKKNGGEKRPPSLLN